MDEERMRRAGRRWIVLSVALVVTVVVLDQLTKILAIATLRYSEPRSYAGGLLTLLYAENRGAFLGLGDGWPAKVRWIVLSVAVAVMLVSLIVWVVKNHSAASPEILLWAMLIGGGFGNLIDRVRVGYVVDFLHMRAGPLQTGVFNVADIAITGAVIALFLMAFRKKPSEPAPASPAQG
jgi:signal peptidase II